jgi:deoxyribodipyrimidine photo-lyase
MEEQISAMAAELGVTVHAIRTSLSTSGKQVLTASGTPFRVFTPYPRGLAQAARSRARVGASPRSPHLPQIAACRCRHWTRGACDAMRRLFSGRNCRTAATREAASSGSPASIQPTAISPDGKPRPHFAGSAHGLLSVREVYASLARVAPSRPGAQRRSIEAYVNELVWREFYMQVLWFRPEVLDQEYQESTRGLPWRERRRTWSAGKRGSPGFPIVDAGMRQLRATGFLHIACGMIVAMFLTKDLHISWKEAKAGSCSG